MAHDMGEGRVVVYQGHRRSCGVGNTTFDKFREGHGFIWFGLNDMSHLYLQDPLCHAATTESETDRSGWANRGATAVTFIPGRYPHRAARSA